jgi:integrase
MGLRPQSEVPHLSWKSLNLKKKKLFIGDDQTGKSNLGRTLEIPECAVNLLRICHRQSGSIINSAYQHKKNWQKLREIAGFIIRDKSGNTVRNDWKHDVARHTAGTMVYAKTQSQEAVRSFLGHTNNTTMLHYVNHSEDLDEEAERFFSFRVHVPMQLENNVRSA